MKEVIPGWLMVEVPSGSIDFDIDYGGENIICKGEYIDTGYIKTGIKIEIVRLVSEVSEEVAKGIVMNQYGDLWDYTKDFAFCATATESLASLARSNGFEPERTLLIKKLE